MSTRKGDVYDEISKQTPRYNTILSNSKYNLSSIFIKPLI